MTRSRPTGLIFISGRGTHPVGRARTGQDADGSDRPGHRRAATGSGKHDHAHQRGHGHEVGYASAPRTAAPPTAVGAGERDGSAAEQLHVGMRHGGAPADLAGDTAGDLAGDTAGDGSRGAARQQERAPLLSRPLASYYLLLSTAGLLVVFGLIMVLSSSSVTAYAADKSPYYFFLKQALWVGLGIPFMLVVSRLPVRALRVVGLPLLVVTTALLVLLLVPGFGRSVNGSTRWIGFGPVVVQPSELVKLALALWGAGLLSARRRQADAGWRPLLVPLVPVATLCATLVMLEPDMGTTVVIVSVMLALLWVAGAPLRMFGALSVVVVALAGLMAIREPYRLERLYSFRDPFNDALNTGYQAVQGRFALASGGWWGLGLGASREKWSYLPNAHTDFILGIIGEELGLLGTVLVVALFAALAYTGIRIAARTLDPFSRLAASAITVWLVLQGVINMAAVVGLVPITGIPLPLISFGGSSLVPTLIAVGVLASVARAEPGAALALDRRRQRRREQRLRARVGGGRRTGIGRIAGLGGAPRLGRARRWGAQVGREARPGEASRAAKTAKTGARAATRTGARTERARLRRGGRVRSRR
ncbi:MAG: putative lipid II flippase FtsW [Frankiaceae bacterium]